MDLGRKIYELRKINKLTQEQLAKALGVSTPAVSKWETGTSMPDIALLAPLARMLHTNLDDLLSFQEHLSEAELDKIMTEMTNTACANGLNAAIELGEQYLREYPNSEELKLRVAMSPSMLAYAADKEYRQDDEKYRELIERYTYMLEELLHSADDTIRMAAIGAVAGRYMGSGRFEEAEAILKRIPTNEFDARHIYSALYLMKGDLEQSLVYAQKNMLKDIQNCIVDIRAQHSVYIKNKEYDKAIRCAEDYYTITKISGLYMMYASDLLVDTYLAMNEPEKAEEHFLNLIDEMKHYGHNYENSFYFSEIASQLKVAVIVDGSEVSDAIRESLLNVVLKDERYAVLRKSKRVEEKLKEFEEDLIRQDNKEERGM
ncbi:helix-turn-helix domain-containing protein [Konateibacter massiliensis]|uniref:helix-turn-helix domain-containing protein n=1 Tax=Konateibacter massiliensis TaxID=2002841 RepID=UPI0015D4E07E|nr:helix-turn-helix transcriptional regulator [Konateibacter massiliensis]